MTSTDTHSRTGLWRVACQRTQAAMLSVALAISAITPATGLAATLESDREQEGTSAPEPEVPDRSSDPGFDPGGETQLPFRIGEPTGGGDDDTGDGPPVDVEPVTDPDALAVEPANDPTVVTPNALEDAVAPVEPAPTPPPPATPAPAPPPTATPTPGPNADEPSVDDRRERARPKPPRDRQATRPIPTVPLPDPVVAPAPAPAPAVPTTPPAVAPVATTERPTAVRPEADAHVVRSGESLWTIASDLLGPGVSDAEIADESDRLYSLNRDRIGPDPDLLVVGTVLRLR